MPTLGNLRTMVRQRCDMVDSDFITDSELNNYINAGAHQLYDELINLFEDHFIQQQYYTLSSGQYTIALPSNFDKLRGVDRVVGSGPDGYCSVPRYNYGQRNHISYSYYPTTSHISYDLKGTNLIFKPSSQAPGDYLITYVPAYTEMTSDSDSIIDLMGYYDVVVLEACIRCLDKQEDSHVATVAAQKAEVMQRIRQKAINRDLHMPQTILKIEGNYTDDFNLRWWYR